MPTKELESVMSSYMKCVREGKNAEKIKELKNFLFTLEGDSSDDEVHLKSLLNKADGLGLNNGEVIAAFIAAVIEVREKRAVANMLSNLWK